jgi:hypothetical protein
LWGVDINRNYDFLWQYRGSPFDKFDIADQLGPVGSKKYDIYKGQFAGSEPETRNMQFIIDSYPSMEYFVDVHSNTQSIYLPWGDAPRQQVQPLMNFSNAAYDKMRGDPNPNNAYKEYLLDSDYQQTSNVANRMKNAISQVRGTSYSVGPSYSAYVPTVATSDDYALSRYMRDPSKRRKIHTMTLECGCIPYTPDNPQERSAVIADVCAGLIEMCCAAAKV